MTNQVQSWYDIPLQQPHDPRILIANTYLDSTIGTFARSSSFLASTWGASPLALSGTVVCTSLHTDNLLSVAEAAQWTFAHQGLNTSASNPPALQKVVFLRGGSSYEMSFSIDFGASNHNGVQLSFRDNAATPGDFTGTGTIPVITFPAVYTGVKTFKVTLKMLGTFVMALRTTSGGTNYLFEMEWNVVE